MPRRAGPISGLARARSFLSLFRLLMSWDSLGTANFADVHRTTDCVPSSAEPLVQVCGSCLRDPPPPLELQSKFVRRQSTRRGDDISRAMCQIIAQNMWRWIPTLLVQMTTLPVKANISNLLGSLASKPLDDDVQEQLGRIQSIINSYITGELPPHYEDSLNIAVAALSSNKPNVLLAQTILWDLEYYRIKSGSFLGRLLAITTGGWPMITAGLGMISTGIIYTLAWAIIVVFNHYPPFMWSGGPELATAILFGILGGSVSILTRIRSPADLQKLNPISLFLNCFFKPLVGATFAAVIYCMLATGIFASVVTERFTGDRAYLYVLFAAVVGFVAGFSERFAADAIGGVEATINKRRE